VDDDRRQLVESLFDAFNRRDVRGISACCHDDMEFVAVTAEQVGRTEPYVGPDGLRAYLEDVASVWEELLITPKQVEEAGRALLVVGRVYLRSRELGIRDMPAGWIWELDEGRFARGRVFADPDEAVRRFSCGVAPEPPRDPGGSRSTTRHR
jgi:ketosteroid isomerase-like protein